MLKWFRTVRRALISTILISLVPVLAIIVLISMNYSRYLQESLQKDVLNQVDAIAFIQQSIIEESRQTLSTIAEMEKIRSMDPAQQLEVLEMLLALHPEYTNIAVSDLNGQVLASPLLSSGTDLSFRRHWQEALETGQFAIGGFINLLLTSSAPAIPFACPIRDTAGNIIGVITMVYNLDEYSRLFESLELPEGAVFGITDYQGVRIFFRPEKTTNLIGARIGEKTWKGISGPEKRGIIISNGSDNVKRFYGYRALSHEAGQSPYIYIVMGYPYGIISDVMMETITRAMLTLAAVVVLAIVLTWIIGEKTFGKRMRMLAQTADRIGEGDFSARTEIPADESEIASLAKAIDTMSAQLEQRYIEKAEEARRLNASLREKETLLREVHHRVKNNMQMILSMISLHKILPDDPTSFCQRLESRIRAIADIHNLLYTSDDLSTIDIMRYIEKLIGHSQSMDDSFDYDLKADSIRLEINTALPLSIIINELILNAAKHARRQDDRLRISINVEICGDSLVMVFRDNGPGFPETAASRTEGSFGMQIIRSLADQIHADLKMENDSGAKTTIRVPMEPLRIITAAE